MGDQNDQSVDTSALERAVRDLTKAAGQTSLAKGGIENSGTYSDGKPAGGGQATDTGSIDEMMIGKMVAAGFDAGTIADFRSYLVAKAGEDMEDEEDEETEGDEPVGAAQGGVPLPGMGKSARAARGEQPLAKSSMDMFREDPTIADNVDVSDYLESITLRVAEQLDGVRKSMAADAGAQRKFNSALATSTVEMAKLVKSQQRVISELGTRLGIIERAPVAAPKAALTGGKARALHKSMAGQATGEAPLRKSELLSTLTFMNLEKGLRSINGQKTSDLVALYEGGGVLDESTVEYVQGWLSANPTEADLAKKYA